METISQKLSKIILLNYPLKKLANFVLSQKYFYRNPIYHQFIHTKTQQTINQYHQFPHTIRIENTNFCNARCYMCPHSDMKRHQGIMSRQLYQKIIDQIQSKSIHSINLHNFGEPLVDKDFVWKVKYAKKKGIKNISTNTNGMLLTPTLSKQIIKSGLDELYISVDAATQKTYQKIRIGLNYQRVQKNIKTLIKLKKKLKSDNPKIILDFLEFQLNQHEVKKFISKWKNLVDGVCISQIHDWSNKKNLGLQKIHNYVEFSQAPCRLPFTDLLVNWDGTVSLCCQDTEGEVILGDLNQQTISQVWQNQKYQKIRQSHLNLQTKNLKLCQNCKLRTFWWSF